MTVISLIAAVDEKMGIGMNNELLCHLPRDLAHFKHVTMGKPVLMGKRTWLSLKKKPLPGRKNMILSTSMNPNTMKDAVIVTSLEEALSFVQGEKELMVIGGGAVYQETLPIACKIYLTHIAHTFDADVFFPTISLKEWECVEKTIELADCNNPYDMVFCEYARNFKKS